MASGGGRYPDEREIETARAIVAQTVEEACRLGFCHVSFHGFEVDSFSWRTRRSGRSARMTRVVVRLDGLLLEQQTLVDVLGH